MTVTNEHNKSLESLKCEHTKVVIVFAEEKDSTEKGTGKDLVVRCGNDTCKEELFRTSAKNRKIINLIPH